VTRTRGIIIRGLGLRLALAFVAVALGAVAAVIALGSMTTATDVDHLVRQQRTSLARATAIAAGIAYSEAGWPRADLAPLTDLVAQAGAAVQVRNLAGQVIGTSPGFAAHRHGPELTEPVRMRGNRVGSVAVRFDNIGMGAAIQQFQAHWWSGRITAATAAALLALVAALLISHRITSSLDRLIRTARARSGGERSARAGDVAGFGEIRELAKAFDQMADASDEQDRVRRNLVADVAHELRTPIAVLQAGHEAMLDGVAQPAADDLVSLRDEVLRLARMVDDLQRLASAEAAALQLTLVPGDLAAIARAAADRLADSFDAADITLRRELREVEVNCDPTRMHEIATNLLTNALKFTPPGGTVLLQTAPQEPAGEHALLRVSDTGIGIQPDDLPRVSDRFFRSPRTAGIAGSGIGLTIVAEVVRGHRGIFDIASEPGVGTQVTVMLPLA
jgi:two-component system sensor histidine kinase BaeS